MENGRRYTVLNGDMPVIEVKCWNCSRIRTPVKGDFSNYESCALKIPYARIDDPSRTFCMGFKPKSMAFLEAFRDWKDKNKEII